VDEREIDAAIADLLQEAQYAKAGDILILKIVRPFLENRLLLNEEINWRKISGLQSEKIGSGVPPLNVLCLEIRIPRPYPSWDLANDQRPTANDRSSPNTTTRAFPSGRSLKPNWSL